MECDTDPDMPFLDVAGIVLLADLFQGRFRKFLQILILRSGIFQLYKDLWSVVNTVDIHIYEPGSGSTGCRDPSNRCPFSDLNVNV